jgi:hypothetical protein
MSNKKSEIVFTNKTEAAESITRIAKTFYDGLGIDWYDVEVAFEAMFYLDPELKPVIEKLT